MKHFRPDEFLCRCGCGLGIEQMQAGTLARLEQARERSIVPFQISSAIRCAEHNKRVGGKENSAHLRGHAVDIVASSSRVRFSIIEALMRAGFERIGIHRAFIHADDDPALPERVIFIY